jgi:hypothetical protein
MIAKLTNTIRRRLLFISGSLRISVMRISSFVLSIQIMMVTDPARTGSEISGPADRQQVRAEVVSGHDLLDVIGPLQIN